MRFNLMTITILCCLTASCMKWGNRENSRLIEQAQQLTEQMPDSALTLLDMANTASFGKAEKAEYQLMRVQARSNAGLDLSTDTEIFGVRDYFIRKKDPEKAALACFYAAMAVTGEDQTTLGMKYYLEAFELVKKTANKKLHGKILYNIGYLYYEKGWYSDAIARYQQALKVIQAMDNQYQLEVYTLNAIANAMMLNSQQDSAQLYYQTAMNLSKLHDDIAMQKMIYNNMGVVYMEMNQLDTAIFYYGQALRKTTTDDDRAYLYKNLTFAFYDQNNLDSARYYLKKTEPLVHNVDNIFFTASWINLLYQIEKAEGNTSNALEYFELYSKYQVEILEKNDRKLLLEMQKKYDMTAKENELNRKRSRTWKFTGTVFVGLLVLAVLYIGVLKKSVKQKTALEKAEQEKEEKTLELEKALQHVYTLQELFNRRDSDMKVRFLEKIGVIKRIALLAPHFKGNEPKSKEDNKKLIEKTYDIVKKLKPHNFMDIANELYPGITKKLKQLCCNLDDREICICCLILFDFNNEELDLFLNHRQKGSLNTIQHWKSAIRRKLDIPPYGDIKKYLEKWQSSSF